MKKFILGFITGGVICAAVTGFAVEYAVSVNPFPITVNGNDAAIEGYNINDSTYFKLRDVSAAVGGFEVGFADNTITITTADAPADTPEQSASAVKPTLDPDKEYNYNELLEYYTDDGLPVYNFDGKHYLNISDIQTHTNFDWHKFDDNYILEYNKYIAFLSLDYYQNIILLNPDDYRTN